MQMMSRIQISVLVAALAVVCSGCGDIKEQATFAETQEPIASTPQSVVISLQDARVETIIPQIIAGAHEQLAAACATQPSAAVHIVSPLAQADVSCRDILSGHQATGEAQEGAGVGEPQEKWSPVGLVCALIAGGLGLLFNYGPTGRVGCHNPRAEYPEACTAVTEGGSFALALACAVAL
jgi:hypothetical protein